MSLRRIAIAAVLAVGLLPAPLAQVTDPAARHARAGSPERTSVHYEDAQRHAGDRIRFKAGGRVTVPFTPRPGDDWTVGGRAPTALPAGALSGAQIEAASTDPSAPAPAPASTPARAPASSPMPPPTSPLISAPDLDRPATWMSERITLVAS